MGGEFFRRREYVYEDIDIGVQCVCGNINFFIIVLVKSLSQRIVEDEVWLVDKGWIIKILVGYVKKFIFILLLKGKY